MDKIEQRATAIIEEIEKDMNKNDLEEFVISMATVFAIRIAKLEQEIENMKDYVYK